MTGTSSAIAVRTDIPADRQSGALAIYADQVQWTPMQDAALNQLGLKNAPDGDRMVFLHQAQRTGLDPFAKQIHMIERGGKWGIQTGIDGFRVMRARAERKAGVRGVLSQAVYVDAEGNEYKRWFKPTPPVGCEITYTVRELTTAGTIDTPYTSYLRFTEYAQYKQDGKLTQKWSQSPAHMLEKCTEADVYRKAFPQDFSGVDLSDAPSAPDEDAPPVQPRRQRITADAIRARQTVTAEVVTPDVPPAGEQPPPSSAATPAPPESAGGTPITEATWNLIAERLDALGVEEGNRARVARQVAGKPAKDLTEAEARKVADTLEGLDAAGLDGLLADMLMESDPRGEVRDGE
jgi:hypothetical protein